MADVTPAARGPDAAGGRGSAGTAPAAGTSARSGPAAAQSGDGGSTDPRAVRVALASSSRLAAEPAIVVAPPEAPLAPIRDSLAGMGPLGGMPRHEVGSAAPASEETAITAADPADGPTVLVDGEPVAVCLVRRGQRRAVLVNGEGSEADRRRVIFPGRATTGADGISRREVVVDGWRIEVEFEPERRAALRERARAGRQATARGGPTEVHAIIPGRVVAVSVTQGDAVTAGQQILVVEAMKMQNELRAPRDGTIKKVAVAPGVTIEVGDLLLVIE